jgi:hypothetical protein
MFDAFLIDIWDSYRCCERLRKGDSLICPEKGDSLLQTCPSYF